MNKYARLIYSFHQTENPYDNCSFTLSIFDEPIVTNANTKVSFQRLDKHPWIKVDGLCEMESRISQLQNQGYAIYGLVTFDDVREYYERIEAFRDETDSPSFIPQEIFSSFSAGKSASDLSNLEETLLREIEFQKLKNRRNRIVEHSFLT